MSKGEKVEAIRNGKQENRIAGLKRELASARNLGGSDERIAEIEAELKVARGEEAAAKKATGKSAKAAKRSTRGK